MRLHDLKTVTARSKLSGLFMEILLMAALGIAYAGTAKLGLVLATINNSASPVWPATGFAFFALVTFGFRYWPAIFLGAFVANSYTDIPMVAAFSIAIGNTLEALAGSYILSRFLRDKKALENQSEVAGTVLSSLGATLISATVGVVTLYYFNKLTPGILWQVWLTWWVGDVLGGLVIAPALVSLWEWRTRSLRITNVFTPILGAVAVSILCYAVFFSAIGTNVLFLVFPALLLALFTFGEFGLRIFTLVISTVAISLTVQKMGPFVGGSLNDNLINLQLFLASVAITTLMIIGFRRSGALKMASVVLLLGWMISGGLFYSFHKAELLRDEARFKEITSDIQRNIETRLVAYQDALLGGIGLHLASDKVSKEEWLAYISTLHIQERYPGINGIGVVRPVLLKDVAKFQTKMNVEGLKNYTIKPLPWQGSLDSSRQNTAEHFAVTFIEPFASNWAAQGLDLASEENRRTAASLARDTGKPSITRHIILVQDQKARVGFLLFYPFYIQGKPLETVSDRRDAFLGWIYAPFVAENFFNGVLGKYTDQVDLYAFEESLRGTEGLLYQSNPLPFENTKFELATEMKWGQGNLSLSWSRGPNFQSAHDTTAAWVGLCGALVSLMLASIVVGLASVGRRAKELADEQTKKLSESERRFKSVTQSAQDAIISADDKGQIISWNPAATRLFGHEEQNVMGQPLTLIMPDRFREAHNKGMQRVVGLKGESRVVGSTVELIGLHKTGREFPIELSISSWESAEGRFFSGIIRDISERKITENILKENESRLRHQFEESTKAREEALSATKLKSEFLANMSHEIRTPINGVIGMTGLLMDTDLSEEQRSFADAIRRSGEALLTVINDILDFSKIEAGKLDFEAIDFSIWEAIEDCQKTLDFMARQKNLSLVTSLSSNLPRFVKGDPGRFKQILLNLLSNAIKFTAKGSITLRGQAVKQEGTQVRLRFEVEDTGIGIQPDVLNKMFQAFTQADSSTRRKFGGTGLGLSISKKLVESMQGQIGVESAEGKGSTFWFEINLPLGEQAAVSTSREQFVVTGFDKKIRILVAEDNSVNQIITQKMLEKMGFYADVVANGHEVLDALNKAPYDLILMDCQMPEMDGYEATRRIRLSKNLQNPSVSIVAMTANAMTGDAEKCLAAGMNDYLAKPVSSEKLLSVLNKWLEKGGKSKG